MKPKYHANFCFPGKHGMEIGDTQLFQVGRMYCAPGTVVPKHVQYNLFELTIVRAGIGTAYTNGVPSGLSAGDIYVSFPGDFHEMISDVENPMRFDFIAFNTTDTELHQALEDIESKYISPLSRIIHDERTGILCQDVLAEISGKSQYRERQINAILIQIIIRLIRNFRDISAVPVPDKPDSELLCLELMNYIDSHIYTIRNLSDIANVTNYNYGYLSTLFSKVTSGTLSDYYRNRRMEAARLMMLDPQKSLTQIADMLNYSSIYAFSRAFHDYYGIAPRTYRNEQRQAEKRESGQG